RRAMTGSLPAPASTASTPAAAARRLPACSPARRSPTRPGPRPAGCWRRHERGSAASGAPPARARRAAADAACRPARAACGPERLSGAADDHGPHSDRRAGRVQLARLCLGTLCLPRLRLAGGEGNPGDGRSAAGADRPAGRDCARLLLQLSALLAAGVLMEKRLIESTHDGLVLESFVASAPGTGPRPSVLLFPNFLGLDPVDDENAGRLVALGYTAFGCDLYGKGNRPANREDAAGFMLPLRENRLLLQARMAHLLDVARQQPEVDA